MNIKEYICFKVIRLIYAQYMLSTLGSFDNSPLNLGGGGGLI